MKKNSRIAQFYRLKKKEQKAIIKTFAGLTEKEMKIIEKGYLEEKINDRISENVIGNFSLPYSVALNFLINGKDYIVPMVTEEPTVVAGASYAAKLARESGGIKAESSGNMMIGQIYFTSLKNINQAKKHILKAKKDILHFANKQKPDLVKIGGGVKDLKIDILEKNKYLRIHLLVDVKDAMGANSVNIIAEKTALFIEKIVKGKAILKIVSNLATERLVKVDVRIKKELLAGNGFSGKEIVNRIITIYKIACSDIYRAVTNNKGILNGMGAVALATGNDWRALEAAAHGWAANNSYYRPLARWYKNKNNDLLGEMTLPVVVGTVGGSINIHSLAKISLKILRVKSAIELSEVVAAVGLMQNLAALKALVSEGISVSHKKLYV